MDDWLSHSWGPLACLFWSSRESLSHDVATNGFLEDVLSFLITIGIRFGNSALIVTRAFLSHPIPTSVVANLIKNALYFIEIAQEVWKMLTYTQY